MKRKSTLFLALLLSLTSRATIHYTSIYEDIDVVDHYYDLDNNGDWDVQFFYNSGTYKTATSDTSTFLAVDGSNVPKAYNAGSGLGTFSWYYGVSTFNVSMQLTYFLQVEKYLMVKLHNNGNAYYGWVLLNNTPQHPIMKVMSYAYSDVPNQTISPGELEPNGIGDMPDNAFKIQQQNSWIQILTPGSYTAAVTNMSGQVVLQQNVTTGIIDAGILPQGIYILTLTNQKGNVVNRKIVL